MRAGDTLIGIDFGLKRIGIAVGQTLAGGARPLRTVAARDGVPDWHALDSIVDEWRPAALVIGLPYNADGSMQTLTGTTETFATSLRERYGITVHTVDERYTSLDAARELADRRARGDRRKLRSGDVDATAAAIILQDWLEMEQRQ